MLSSSEVELLSGKVLRLLSEVGILVENEEMTQVCLRRGCIAGADHRIRIPEDIVCEIVEFQKPSLEAYERNHELIYTCGPDWTHHLIWTGQIENFREDFRKQFSMQAFDCGATIYYDYPNAKARPVNTEVFDTMMKFAEATPEIGYTSMWYRQDVPPMIERLDSLYRSMRWTKKFAGIEAIYPEVVKYLKEASVILTEDPRSSTYLAGSECMTSPLVLEKRSAEDILERKKNGVHRYHVASMPTMGVSTPVTLAGSVIMGAAEILGGMVICWCVDPESDISGRMITLVADMRNGNSTTFGPEYTHCNMAVRQLFLEIWGGHCMAEVFLGPTARRPGLQAVFENLYATSCRQRWDHNPWVPYAGMGVLNLGGIGSPTQFMLDMEIRKAQWLDQRDIVVNEATMDFEEILEATEKRSHFLMSDHTLRYFHEMWSSDYFRSEEEWPNDDNSVLDKCEEKWRSNLAKWEPPQWPKEKLTAMSQLVERAKKEFDLR